ncbi:hypothetical protein C8J57DRAFT_1469769 [Mycena rebaudengoi]|nr:hypothetical protein C8J57DRAFT_1469769 [Mycena rebaudengoi]
MRFTVTAVGVAPLGPVPLPRQGSGAHTSATPPGKGICAAVFWAFFDGNVTDTPHRSCSIASLDIGSSEAAKSLDEIIQVQIAGHMLSHTKSPNETEIAGPGCSFAYQFANPDKFNITAEAEAVPLRVCQQSQNGRSNELVNINVPISRAGPVVVQPKGSL